MAATGADPALVARYDALGTLAQTPLARRCGSSTRLNGYRFPGDPTALNAAFATPHDSHPRDLGLRHQLPRRAPGFDLHRRNASDQSHGGHILPVIFFGHLGEKLNDVVTPARAVSIPRNSGMPWRVDEAMTQDMFAPGWGVWDWAEHDLEDLRRTWNVSPGGR